MVDNSWLAKVAVFHKDWVKVIQSFGEYDYAEDIVQETYISLWKYANADKILDENGEVRKGYVYFTLRSLYYQYYNKKKKVNKVDIDGCWELYDDSNLNEQEAYHNICLLIDEEIKNWNNYDRLLFKLYRDNDLSMRDIAKGTTISLMSIFNSLKNHKEILKQKFQKQYTDYIERDYENEY